MTDVFTHPWLGGLFGDAATNAALAPDQQLQNILAVEGAYTAALLASGDITPQAANAVADLLADPQLDMDALHHSTGQDGMIVPGLIRQLKARLPDAFHSALHTGLTSQDVIDTALALSLKSIITDVLTRLTGLDNALHAVQIGHGSNLLMGRTRMQAALAITVADRVATWQLPLTAHAGRLQALGPSVQILSIGGAVGTRVVDDVAGHMAKHLDLTLPEKAPHVMRGHLADLANVLALITGTLGKMGQDIALMAQQGVDDVQLSAGGRSSAMAHKNNPIRAELLVALARFNATQLAGMHHALVHEQERSGAAWTLEWMLLPPMLQATGGALHSASILIESIMQLGQSPDQN